MAHRKLYRSLFLANNPTMSDMQRAFPFRILIAFTFNISKTIPSFTLMNEIDLETQWHHNECILVINSFPIPRRTFFVTP